MNDSKKDRLFKIVGLLLVSFIVVPYFILGEGSYLQLHDQIDGEILNYIYQAKYFFKGNIVEEFLGGMDKLSMLPPAPLGVLFYLVLPPFYAYVFMQWFVLILGFLGMYSLCKYMNISLEISGIVAVLFAYMPFYPTYGLASLGQPLLIYCFLRYLKEEKKSGLLGIGLYAAFSSLSLIGFVWIGFVFLLGILCFFQKKKKECFRIVKVEITLCLIYLLMNIRLLLSLFGTQGFISHRQEFVLTPIASFWEQFFFYFTVGGSYSNVYSKVVILCFLLLICAFLGWKAFSSWKGEEIEETLLAMIKKSLLLFMSILFLSLLASMWNLDGVIDIRNRIGGSLASFQADRIYWTFPFLWTILFAFCLQGWYLLIYGKKSKGFLLGLICIFCGLQGLQIGRDSTLNINLRLLVQESYQRITWESIYMPEVFQEIDGYIGEDKEKVRVVSLGIYPSAALYNGYLCGDGYSNNYDLAYKHEFRKIIEEELAKDQENRTYFDNWGNRCYFIHGAYGYSALIGKEQSITYRDCSWNREAMRELNIKYIFAAGRIENAKELGLTLLREAPFSSSTSYYEVWVYQLEELQEVE